MTVQSAEQEWGDSTIKGVCRMCLRLALLDKESGICKDCFLWQLYMRA